MQLDFECEFRNATDIPEKHVRFLHIIERCVESRGDRFFNQTFTQTDPEIAGEDFDNVLTLTCVESLVN